MGPNLNLQPKTISVPVKDGKEHINYDIFVDPESGLDVDPQSGEMRTREQTIEMVQAVYSVGAESMAEELERYNRWIQDPENKAKAQKLMTSNKGIAQKLSGDTASNFASQGAQSSLSSASPSQPTTIFTPEMALEKAAECRKRGNDWLAQKEYRKALRVYSEGLAYLHISQRCGMLLSNRAEVLLKMQRFDEAASGAEEAMRRFEIFASAGAVGNTTAPTKKEKAKPQQDAKTGSTMEIISDDDDEDSENDDEHQDLDLETVNSKFLIIENIPQILGLEKQENANVFGMTSLKLRRFFGAFDHQQQYHTLPANDVVGPPNSGGVAGQNLRSLWLKAAFRLVRAHEGNGHDWKALSVSLGILNKFASQLEKKTNKEELPNKKEWIDISIKLLQKLQLPAVSKIIQFGEQQKAYAIIAAEAVKSLPFFQAYTAKNCLGWSASKQQQQKPTSTKITFAPLFGWDESNLIVASLQNKINNDILKPILESKKDKNDSIWKKYSSLQEIAKYFGVDAFAPFLLQMSSLLVNRKDEDAAKALVVDGPVSLDRWLGRRPTFSYPDASPESDFFFIVAETAAKLVEWIHLLPEEKFKDEFFFLPDDFGEAMKREIQDVLPLKMKTFAFNRERTLHVVFALTQIAEATRSTRNLMKLSKQTSAVAANNSSDQKMKQQHEWCWLESCLIDVSCRIQYNSALRSFLFQSSSSTDSSSSPYFRLEGLQFPDNSASLSENNVDVTVVRPEFGTFAPTTWGTLDVVLVSPKQPESRNPIERETQEEGDVDGGDWMIPILANFENNINSATKPCRLGHPGFYGDIVG